MEKMNRRNFIRAGIAGVAGLSVLGTDVLTTGCSSAKGAAMVDLVKLGETGLNVSRIAMGTGTIGGNKESNQTRLGMETFVKMARHAYERGIRFYEMADMYGSHPYVKEALKPFPRENVSLLTKFWASPNPADNTTPTREIIDRMRQEAGTEYFDAVLMHCVMNKDWRESLKYHIDGLLKAKQEGVIKAVGASFHSLEALEEAVDFPWIDVMQVRINPFGDIMDADHEVVNALLAKAKKNGKGIVGMKIFSQGEHISDSERQVALEYAVQKANIHCMTIGFESEAQMDDAIERVMALI